MKQLTKEQGIILTGFTGKMCCKMEDFHKDLEIRMRRPVFTHEMASKDLWEEIKKIYKEDFMKLVGVKK